MRNNVQWIPTWGAMQDATHTLSSRRGNAFDIAGLEIALLRASGIPARYAVGTIEVEADRFSNWAGGIATTSLVEGGRIAAVRMEHVWVEAAVDYLPSRGAVNKSADTWIALDRLVQAVRVQGRHRRRRGHRHRPRADRAALPRVGHDRCADLA